MPKQITRAHSRRYSRRGTATALLLLCGISLRALPPLSPGDKTAVRRGIDLLYNLDYNSSRQAFKPLFLRQPRHPAPWFYLAMVDWIRCTHYDLNPESAARFHRLIHTAVYLAEQQLRRDPANGRMLFYLAGAKGFLGRMAVEQQNWFSAVQNGLQGYRLFQQAQRLLPHDPDISFGLGLFEFYSGRVPALLRPAVQLLGISGNWRKGLLLLEQAAAGGGFTATEAALSLAYIYLYDLKQPHKAMPLLQRLHRKYPENPLLHIALIECRYFTGEAARALREAEEMLARIRQKPEHSRFQFRALCLAGKICYSLHLDTKGIAYLSAALACSPAIPPGFRAWAKLRRGLMLLRTGNHAAAARELHPLVHSAETKIRVRAAAAMRRLERRISR